MSTLPEKVISIAQDEFSEDYIEIAHVTRTELGTSFIVTDAHRQVLAARILKALDEHDRNFVLNEVCTLATEQVENEAQHQ